MREIKFRAWDNVLKQHLPNVQNHIGNDGWAFGELLKDTDRYVVEQYTGLKDKSGKEIYEGDICKFIDHPTNLDSCISYVKFSEGNFIDGYMGWPINNYGSDWIEIIGNIHENPELL